MRRVSTESDRCASIRSICESEAVLVNARKETRYPLTDRLDDPELLRRLSAFAEADELDAASPDVVKLLTAEAARLLRDALVTTLIEDHGIEDLVAAACRRKRIRGSEPQVAFCLVVLLQKRDPARSRAGAPRRRTYALDIGEDGFDQQLERWAGAIAGHLSCWGETYAKVFAESEYGQSKSLRELISVAPDHSQGDVADIVSDVLADTITRGLELDEMSLVRARDEEPHGAEYVFQSPLRRWVGTSFWRRTQQRSDEYDDEGYADDAGDWDEDEDNEFDLDTSPESDADHAPSPGVDERLDLLIDRVGKLARTRQWLAEAIRVTAHVADGAANITPDNEDDSALFQRYRAELEFVLDGLIAEHQVFEQMLSYVVLALSKSHKRQVVAIVSLRADWLDDAVRDHIAGRMRAVLEGDREPVPALILKAGRAARKRVPQNRARELRRLRADPSYRASRFMAHATLLDTLPAVVGGSLDSMAAALPAAQSSRSVASTRNQAAAELNAVDRAFGRSFRRYTMERHGLG
jgi:hypothetical protein